MSEPWSALDVGWMRRALELASRGRGAVEPNPLVAAVLVREGEVVGEGWHQRFGGPHAEVEALRGAGNGARGATLYVTLEPCCHYGKTAPCTRALIEAGVARVVAACRDPFPPVSANGLPELRAAGIAVEAGLLRREAQELNAPYFKHRATGRPFVTAKWAITLDGKVATRRGDSRWVSSAQARERVQQLRAVSDAVLVGIGTVLADDPLLTCRLPSARALTRIVLDGSAQLPLGSRLVESAAQSPVLVAATADAPAERVSALRARGVEVLLLPAAEERVSLEALLDELGRRGMTNLLVEGGPMVFAGFFVRRLVDAVVVYLAPKLIGGEGAPGALGGEGAATMAEAVGLDLRGWERVGEDLELRATVAGVFGTYFPAD
jgi:diaminohydroxyphosphoribosylaminopyrimidine deaminase/5-amino-6-(5-phosphoribosylamino)uracil reductase